MRCLITGINGFAASHLADHLISEGHEVIGTHRIRSKMDNIDGLNIKLMHMDLNDPFGVESVIKSVQPDVVFHLAAQSFVAFSYTHPIETIKTNVIGTVNVLEAVRKHWPFARVHIASSSQIYGKISMEAQPMGKETLFNPMQPYDSSKLAQDMIALQYFNSYGLKIIRTRAFNNSGPRRGDSFAESNWAKQIAEIEKGLKDPVIYHGNLESWRDYIDIRDTVKCYAKAAFDGDPGGLYIIGSGKPHSMRDVLETLVFYSDSEIKLEQDPSRMRPSDTPYMRADMSDMEWLMDGANLIPFETTMRDLLDYWRGKV